MTTFFDGLDVPQTTIEYFSFTTNASGIADVVLKYVPTSIGELSTVVYPISAGVYNNLFVRPTYLAGKNVRLEVSQSVYEKADTPSGTTDASGGGATAEPHSHGISHSWAVTDGDPAVGFADVLVAVVYHPVGGS